MAMRDVMQLKLYVPPIPSVYMKSHLCMLTYVAHRSLCNVRSPIVQWDVTAH